MFCFAIAEHKATVLGCQRTEVEAPSVAILYIYGVGWFGVKLGILYRYNC